MGLDSASSRLEKAREIVYKKFLKRRIPKRDNNCWKLSCNGKNQRRKRFGLIPCKNGGLGVFE